MASQPISKFIREGDKSRAPSLNDQLVKLGCRADDASIASLISLYGKQHKLKKAIEVSFCSRRLSYHWENYIYLNDLSICQTSSH